MTRVVVAGVIVAATVATLGACKDHRGPITDGVSRVHVRFQGEGERWSLALDYTVRLATPPLDGSAGVEVKAACQVGADRFVDVSPGEGTLIQGTAVELHDNPFILSTLPAEPSLCDLEIRERSYRAKSRVLGRFCVGDTITHGACAPNHVPDDGVGPLGVTAQLISVVGADKDDVGFPAHLTVRYKFTAHRDMPARAYFVRTTSCGDHGSDSTWHEELAELRAGESAIAGQNTYQLGRPAPGTKCETTFGVAAVVDGPVTAIDTFCHVDQTITHGPCT